MDLEVLSQQTHTKVQTVIQQMIVSNTSKRVISERVIRHLSQGGPTGRLPVIGVQTRNLWTILPYTWGLLHLGPHISSAS